MKWKPIGVIGGLGPRASAFFYKTLIDICSHQYHAVQDADFPKIIVTSLASQGLSETGHILTPTLFKEIEFAINVFDQYDISHVSIPCNSIFASFEHFSTKAREKIIVFPDVLANEISKIHAKNVFILCSRGLRKSRKYDNYFLKRGITPFYPDNTIQAKIDGWILDVMGSSYSMNSAKDLDAFIKASENRFESVLIACTELSVLLNLDFLPDKVVDSVVALAKETLLRAIEE